MIELEQLASEIHLARRELKNIRQECMKQRVHFKSEIVKIKELFSGSNVMNKDMCHCKKEVVDTRYSMVPIGFISSCFKNKNGIPRQPSLCPAAKGKLTVEKSVFTNPEHSLIGLSEFSYIWILFVFHENGVQNAVKAKVHPPRLNGSSVGVFSTRSPHRPCPIGLSLTKLDKIEGSTLFLSGIDLLDGTPVLDVKPYIPSYDIPLNPKELSSLGREREPQEANHFLNDVKGNHSQEDSCHQNEEVINSTIVNSSLRKEYPCYFKSTNCSVASYLQETPEYLEVSFTSRALEDLKAFHAEKSHDGLCNNCFSFTNYSEAKLAITDVLKNDPRSVYRRKKCSDRLYYFNINNLHVTCWFDDNIAEVLRLRPSNINKV